MMSFFFGLLMLIPLCFISNFWLVQYIFFIFTFLFFLMFQ